MHAISVSTEVFAEIWKRHKSGDRDVDDILRRVLNVPPSADQVQRGRVPTSLNGYVDARFEVRLPEGFEIFRTYKGQEYRARATQGKWVLLNDNRTFPSLNKLSWAIVNGNENAWYNWKFKNAHGEENYIHALRNLTRIPSRI
jgi:hypothetical protein